ncbi:hypothetical protein F511_47039 [Dorcoceras hygrometricum]|uniref:Uncharacterized protein n=1 Tax=Dorcoceras hygrometricum TaxID=472368 RepID=A0A2Z6ZS28_9LAMI|nr:hypothetical protein F511_47039 [Dorcoceras hygrometricum]
MRDVAGRCRRGGAIQRALAGGWLLLMRRRLGYWSRDVVDEMRALAARWPCACRGRVRPCGARDFREAVAGRPPLRRSSGDVVTAEFS